MGWVGKPVRAAIQETTLETLALTLPEYCNNLKKDKILKCKIWKNKVMQCVRLTGVVQKMINAIL